MNDIVQITDQSYLSKDNFEHFYRMANMMSKSQLVPKAFFDKPHDVLVAFEMGRSLGLSPLSAIQNIAVINGKPALYGDAVLAVCSGHPEFENIIEEAIVDKDGKTEGFRCLVKRKGRSEVIRIFTVEDAKKANLWAKAGPWSQYPSRMLQMRARAFALRDSFADALGGIRIVEEVQDYKEAKDVTPKRNPLESVQEALKSNLSKSTKVADE